MHALPFQQKSEVERVLDRVELEDRLEDLVLAFLDGDDKLVHLVYNSEQPPPSGEKYKTHRLRGYRVPASAAFDSLMVSFSAIDVLFANIPTHGVNFYSVEHVFRRRRQHEALRRTSYKLARTLLAHIRQLPPGERQRRQLWHRACLKILQLATPEILASHPAENLLAVVLFDERQDDSIRCLRNYLDRREDRYELVYNHPHRPVDAARLQQLTADRRGQPWVIGLEEVGLLHEPLGPQTNKYLDLRAILRNCGEREALRETCRQLAQTFWARWTADKRDERLRDAAYMLAAEVWLGDEEVEDLVALFPHQKFDRFLSRGEAVRVYREEQLSPRNGGAAAGRHSGEPPAKDPPKFSVSEVLNDNFAASSRKRLRDYDPSLAVSFRQMAGLSKFLSGREGACRVLDLGLVLWKAGKVAELGRIFWLLSRHLLKPPATEREPISPWPKLNAEAGAITDMAVRAALTYSMHDPWRWRQGRYEQFVISCYQHLDDCLHHQQLHAERESLNFYYRARREWYGCLQSDNYKGNLLEMVAACNRLTETAEREKWAVPAKIAGRAERLRAAGAALLNPQLHQPREDSGWFDNTAFLREVADAATDLGEPTPAFGRSLNTYLELRRRVQSHLDEAGKSRPSPRAVEELVNDLLRWRAVLYGPAHETFLLDRAGRDAISLITPLKQSMGTGAVVILTVQNSRLTMGKEETLVVEVRNIGDEAVTGVELAVERAGGLESMPKRAPLRLDTLAAGEFEPYMLDVTATAAVVTLNLRYSYTDARGHPHAETQGLSVAARKSAVKLRVNYFEAGRPVFGENQFFGRDAELNQLLTRLPKAQGTNPVVLRGPRRIGKSSLLREFKLVLESPEEREARGIDPDFQAQMANVRAVMTNLQSHPNLLNTFPQYLSSVLSDVARAFDVEPAARQQMLAEFNARHKDYNPPRAFIQQVDRVLGEHPGQRLVVLIDELDVLFRPELHDVSGNLRNIIESKREVSWFTSSTMLATAVAYGSPWYNLLQVIELRGLEWAAANELIQNQSLQAGIQWDIDSITHVLEQTGQRPYLIQLICSAVVDHINRRGIDEVGQSTVKTVTSQWLNDSGTTSHHFGFIWSEARWMGKLIMWFLNQHIPPSRDPSEQKHAVARVSIREQIKKDLVQFARSAPSRPDIERLNEEFQEQMYWLEKIADVLTIRGDDTVDFNIPLVHRWLASVMAREGDFMLRALRGLFKDLTREAGAAGG